MLQPNDLYPSYAVALTNPAFSTLVTVLGLIQNATGVDVAALLDKTPGTLAAPINSVSTGLGAAVCTCTQRQPANLHPLNACGIVMFEVAGRAILLQLPNSVAWLWLAKRWEQQQQLGCLCQAQRYTVCLQLLPHSRPGEGLASCTTPFAKRSRLEPC